MRERKVPERRAHHLGEVGGGDVDHEVESALLGADAVEDGLHLRVVGVVAGDGDGGAAERLDLRRGAVEARQLPGHVLDRARGQVGDGPTRADLEGDALADVLARAGDQRNLS